MNFFDITYLKQGNTRQQKAFYALDSLQIMSKLQAYNPVLVGTIPIAIDIDESDLDIVCEVTDFKDFQTFLHKEFGHQSSFRMKQIGKDNRRCVVTNFHYHDLHIEIFGQDLPTILQNGYRNMLIEYRLLRLFGPVFKKKVIHLKRQVTKHNLLFPIC